MDNDELIKKLLADYKKKIEHDRHTYHTVKKLNPEFMESNRQRAKLHYEKNKAKKKETYEKNKELHKSKNLYAYYKRNNKLDIFKDKHKDKYDNLVSIGFIHLEPQDDVSLPADVQSL